MKLLAILPPFSSTMEWISLPSAAVFKRVKRGMARLNSIDDTREYKEGP